MKLLGMTAKYGGRQSVSVDYSSRYFLAGEVIPVESLVVLDLPGLVLPKQNQNKAEDADEDFDGDEGEDFDEDDFEEEDFDEEDDDFDFGWSYLNYDKAITAYLEERGLTVETGKKSRRSALQIPAENWRRATLDDVLETENGNNFIWQVNGKFSLAEFHQFAEKHVPVAQTRLREVLAITDRAERVEALTSAQKFVQLLWQILSQIPHVIGYDINTLRKELDREAVRLAREAAKAEGRRGLMLEDRLTLLEKIKTDEVGQEILNEAAKDIATAKMSGDELLKLLERLRKNKTVYRLTQWNPEFWSKMAKVVELPPNVRKGTKLDITHAHETTVELTWHLLSAKRIGAIAVGRKALVVNTRQGTVYYIRGERKLKFQVQSAPGGKLEKYGCILTLPAEKSKQELGRFLLEVERIDALTQLDPEAAFATLPDAENLPTNHPARLAVVHARTDHRQARILADLLIELRTGVDADIIRQMARRRR